ncbi:MBL fold metallo-hydrolase RNA specificity domain-containing protein [Mycoplasmopsis cricetuli]|uniref:MBL fold metallo-hydrolase RNA specificity domain-containing protein n=1 Tax=Mycoplasmopsis cricetuli TaxID=171283 RepID=UPI00046F7FE8|nr:ribonuclease J [Mycoplasmopsis cricetuli]
MEEINIFALGGQDENGKNCYVFEYNSDIFIINSGVKVPINTQNGVDGIIPDFSYLEKFKKHIKGIFITDIKNESFSALPWLIMKIPGIKIYTSAFNKIIIIDRLQKYKINSSDYKIEVINSPVKFESLTVHPIKLAWSIPFSLGYNFETLTGNYLFMFNFIEGEIKYYGKTNFQELKEFFSEKPINAIICDSGKSNFSGRAIDRLGLPEHIEEAILKTNPNSRIVIGAYDEDMLQLQEIFNIALKTNRPVCAYGKTYGQLLHLLTKVSPDLQLPKLIDYRMINKHENVIVLVTGSVERLFLRFVRITSKKDVYLKLKKTDTVIMMAHPINGLESLAAATLDEIAKISPRIFNISEGNFFVHHPSKEDIYNLVSHLRPKYFIPAQGLYRYLVDVANYINEDKQLSKHTKTLMLLNGKIAHFIDDKLFSQNGKISQIGDVIIDGFGIGDISSEVISERDSLGREGVIIINFLYNSKTQKIASEMHIEYVGVIDESDKDYLDDIIFNIIIDNLENHEFLNLKDFNEKLRKIIRKKIYKLTEKDPMVIIGINNA